MLSCSTSYPSGNQVDGSPLVAIEQGVLPSKSNTKTVSNWARVGPRTPVLLTMNILFLISIPSISRLGSPIIVLDYVLKLWIELRK